jgi:hypothetical protein
LGAGSIRPDAAGGLGRSTAGSASYDAHYLLDDGYASLAVAPFTVTD